jgi:hypothetical protein
VTAPSKPLPPIGSSERDKLEALVIDFADRELARYGEIRPTLRAVVHDAMLSGWSHEAAVELAEHVEQCWITRILR